LASILIHVMTGMYVYASVGRYEETSPRVAAAAGAMILPLALAQFIASYAATNMNVAISAIATDLGTNVAGVQTAITLFTLTMAALMIPGSKLTDIWGRKPCFPTAGSAPDGRAKVTMVAPYDIERSRCCA
jgi:MFS family permease